MSERALITDAIADVMACCDDPAPHIQICDWNGSHFNIDGYCWNCYDNFGGRAELGDVTLRD